MIGPWLPTRRASLLGGGEAERGAWFDEILLGLGPAADAMDLRVVGELRREGLALAVRRWLTEDLNRVAFAAARGDSVDDAVAAARHQLHGLTEAVDARLQASSSQRFRRRLKQAGVWGTSGLLVSSGGTLVAGGSAGATAAAGAIGFALSAAAGATGASQDVMTPDPVLFDLLRPLRSSK